MSSIVPEDKLDDEQREFLDNADIVHRNWWIRGFPGSGKSVLLAYTFKKIIKKEPKAKVLVVVFTHSLIKRFEADFAEMELNAKIVTSAQFKKGYDNYDYILSDEVQDLTPSVLLEMKQRAKHIVVAGDENQSIYEKDPSGEPTVSPSQINELLDSRYFSLTKIHRLSRNIINVVNMFLPNMNIFAAKVDATKQSTMVRLCEANNVDEEIKYVMQESKRYNNNGETVGVLIPRHNEILSFIQNVIQQEGKPLWVVQTTDKGGTDYNSLNAYLNKCGIPLQYVGNGVGNFDENSRKINVMTYHSSKGLDFDNVFLPFLNNSLIIVPSETMSKIIFMVAMTRSRGNLYLTYNGYKHEYLKKFASECTPIDIHNILYNKPKISGGGIFARKK